MAVIDVGGEETGILFLAEADAELLSPVVHDVEAIGSTLFGGSAFGSALTPVTHDVEAIGRVAFRGALLVPPIDIGITTPHARALQSLLPPGRAWPRDSDALMTKVVDALGREFKRVDDRGAKLLLEAHPSTAVEMLPEWERLTRAGTGPADAIEVRQAAVTAKLLARGRFDEAFFISLAETLGYEITIEYVEPFRTGFGLVGMPLAGEGWVYVMRVVATSGDNDAALERMLRAAMPAHNILWMQWE